MKKPARKMPGSAEAVRFGAVEQEPSEVETPMAEAPESDPKPVVAEAAAADTPKAEAKDSDPRGAYNPVFRAWVKRS